MGGPECVCGGVHVLFDQTNFVSRAHHPFDQNRGVDSCFSFVVSRYIFQDLGICLRGLRIEADHPAPDIALEHRITTLLPIRN